MSNTQELVAQWGFSHETVTYWVLTSAQYCVSHWDCSAAVNHSSSRHQHSNDRKKEGHAVGRSSSIVRDSTRICGGHCTCVSFPALHSEDMHRLGWDAEGRTDVPGIQCILDVNNAGGIHGGVRRKATGDSTWWFLEFLPVWEQTGLLTHIERVWRILQEIEMEKGKTYRWEQG